MTNWKIYFLFILVFLLGICVGELGIEVLGDFGVLLPYGDLDVGSPKLLDNFNQTNYTIKSYTLAVSPKSLIKNLSKQDSELDLGFGEEVIGLNYVEDRVIYVGLTNLRDVNGYNIPDLCVLGHETYHFSELGGYWHE